MKKINTLFMVLLAAIWMIPLVWVVSTAFKDASLSTSLEIGQLTIENFITVITAIPYFQYFQNSIAIVLGILGVQLVTATLAAYAFARLEFPGKNILFFVVLVQLMIPNDILIFPNYRTLSELALLDTKVGIMMPYFATAFGIFLLRQNFKTIPYELEEAARIDGCNLFQILRMIYIPLSKPTYTAFALVSASYHWNNFLWPLIVTNSVENRPLTVGLSIFAKSYESGAQWAEVSAGTFLVIFPMITLFFIFQKQFMSSFIQSGIK